MKEVRHIMSLKRGLIVVLACTPACQMLNQPVAHATPPSFYGLGSLPDSTTSSYAHAISNDGQVVIGTSSHSGAWEAFKWTPENGMVGLGELSGGTVFSDGFGVSGDGRITVGASQSSVGYEAFSWSMQTGMSGLGILGGNFSIAENASFDGSVIVGTSVSGNSGLREAAFRYTTTGGMTELGYLPGGKAISYGADVSDDGNIIVGTARNAITFEAFRWTENEGMIGLGLLPNGYDSRATAISGNGNSVIGYARDVLGQHPFLWTSSSGVVSLGDLPGGTFEGIAEAISGDGTVVVGESQSSLGTEAFIWDSSLGMRSLKDMLSSEVGLNLSGWVLQFAHGVSEDGLTITGSGINPFGQAEAWIAHIPEPATAALLSVWLLIGLSRKRSHSPI